MASSYGLIVEQLTEPSKVLNLLLQFLIKNANEQLGEKFKRAPCAGASVTWSQVTSPLPPAYGCAHILGGSLNANV